MYLYNCFRNDRLDAPYITDPARFLSCIPAELKQHCQWVNWRYEKTTEDRWTKVPLNPRTLRRANITNPENWSDFDTACVNLRSGDQQLGLGFVFVKGGGIIGVDIDRCIQPDGSLSSEGQAAIDAFGTSYYERSPSGTGLKFFMFGQIPGDGHSRKDSKRGVEVYASSRFFTVTADSLFGVPLPLANRQTQLLDWFNQRFNIRHSTPEIASSTLSSKTVDEIIELGLRGRRFRLLFNEGDYSGFPSQSEADLALCFRIAMLGGPDPELIDEVFQESALHRPKWDRTDYRERTIMAAIRRYHSSLTCRRLTPEEEEQFQPAVAEYGGTLSLGTKNTDLMPPERKSSYFEFIDSAEFARKKYEHRWIIPDVLKAGEPCIVAGPSKSLKTTYLIELCISIASGKMLWNRFPVCRNRVAIVSAESGEETLRETADRICQSKGIDLASLGQELHWSFRPPNLTRMEHLQELEAFVAKNAIKVVAIDPLYLCLGSASSEVNNQFVVGELLSRLGALQASTGATVILAAHTTKNVKAGVRIDLSHISHAGFGQWARQWMLVIRREAYDEGRPGRHKIQITVGGSAGHSNRWILDIDEGDRKQGRVWKYEFVNTHGLSDDGQRQLTASSSCEESTTMREKVLAVITPEPVAITALAESVGCSRNNQEFRRTLTQLIGSGHAVEHVYPRGKSQVKKYCQGPAFSSEPEPNPVAGI